MTARKNAEPKIEEQPPDEPQVDGPVVLEPLGPTDVPPVRTDSPVPAATPTPGDGEVVLVVDSGGDVFKTGRDDVPELTRTGIAVPVGAADDLIAFAADNHVTVHKLED